MSDWMLNNYAAVMAGIVAITVILAIAGMKRLEKDRKVIRDYVCQGGFLSAEEFQRDWAAAKASGSDRIAGFKHEDGPGCYIVESFPAGTEDPDFANPPEIHVGQSPRILDCVWGHLDGKSTEGVYVHFERCFEPEMDDFERRLADAFDAGKKGA